MKYDRSGWRKPKEIDNFKSELEFITARWLSKLKIPYIYEPKTYKTKRGNYTPDFLLPETNIFIECKPNFKFVKEHVLRFKQFCLEQKSNLLIVTKDKLYCMEYASFEKEENVLFEEEDETLIVNCRKCGVISFCTQIGFWHCRKCDNHEGDHDCTTATDYFSIFYKKVKENDKKR